MTQIIQLPAHLDAEENCNSRPLPVFNTQTAKASRPGSIISERDHEGSSIIDMCKVVAFLILAVVVRSAFTHQPTSHVEGLSEPPAVVEIPKVLRAPDLIDLSTAGF